VQRFRGGLVFKAHRLLYHSTLGLRVIKKKRRRALRVAASALGYVASGTEFRVPSFGYRVSGTEFRVSGVGFRVWG